MFRTKLVVSTFVVLVIVSLVAVVPVFAEDGSQPEVVVVYQDPGATPEASDNTQRIEIVVPSAVNDSVSNVEDDVQNDPITALVILVIGGLIGGSVVYIKDLRLLIDQALGNVQDALDKSPLGFLDIDQLANQFIRAALTHNDLQSEQQQLWNKA